MSMQDPDMVEILRYLEERAPAPAAPQWMIVPTEPPAHTFTPASAARALTLCGQYSVTIESAYLWQPAQPDEPRCPDCNTLATLDFAAVKAGKRGPKGSDL